MSTFRIYKGGGGARGVTNKNLHQKVNNLNKRKDNRYR